MTTDKYDVNPLDGPSRFAEAFADLQRRVAALEGSPLVGSNLTAYDPTTGNELVVVGNLGDGTSGLLVVDVEGQVLFRVDTEAGQTAPQVNPVPVASVGTLLSGTASAYRPGTTFTTFVSIWAHEWWTVGDKIDYYFTAWTNGGTMDWQITCHEVGASAVVVVGPVTETAAQTNRSGTLTIPSTALVSGTAVAGRLMRMDIEAKKNSGASTVDISLNQAPRNYG